MASHIVKLDALKLAELLRELEERELEIRGTKRAFKFSDC